jgi:hypothetical protein
MSEYPDPVEGSRVHAEFFDITNRKIDHSVLGWRVGAGQRPSDEYLGSQGFFGVVRTPQPVVNPRTQRAKAVPMAMWPVDNATKTVTETWVVETLGEDDIAQMTKERTAAVRLERDARLRASDFTQLGDAPVTNKQAWAAYRKALRDMTKNLDPFNPVWPELPASE